MSPANESKTNPSAVRDWLLVIDDDEPIRVLLTTSLGSETMEVVSAIDARSALLELDSRATEPLVVVVDVLMPGMDGLTLTRKLSTRLTRSKIIVMSGHLSNESWWPVDLREITFLAKPFRMAELEALIETARIESAGKA